MAIGAANACAEVNAQLINTALKNSFDMCVVSDRGISGDNDTSVTSRWGMKLITGMHEMTIGVQYRCSFQTV